MTDAELCIKRAFDIVVSAIGMIIISPLLAAIALAVKISSKGDIFYKQERIGLYGIPFNIYKFLTVNNVAEPPNLL